MRIHALVLLVSTAVAFPASALAQQYEPSTPTEKVKITHRNVSVTGAVEKAIVLKVMRHHHSELRRCFERALDEQPELGSAELTLAIEISYIGNVTNASASSDVERLDTCIEAVVEEIRFPHHTRARVEMSVEFDLVDN